MVSDILKMYLLQVLFLRLNFNRFLKNYVFIYPDFVNLKQI